MEQMFAIPCLLQQISTDSYYRRAKLSCERQAQTMDATHETIDTERFELRVEHFLCPVLGNFMLKKKRSIIVLDNASIHHSDRVKGQGAY